MASLFFLAWICFFPDKDEQPGFTIQIQNLLNDHSPVCIAIYRREDKFPGNTSYLKRIVARPDHAYYLTVSENELKEGFYAIACFQDVNQNDKLDKNLFGIPTEPYGFSNDFRPKFKAPSFDQCKFLVDPDHTTVKIKIGKYTLGKQSAY